MLEPIYGDVENHPGCLGRDPAAIDAPSSSGTSPSGMKPLDFRVFTPRYLDRNNVTSVWETVLLSWLWLF